MRTLLRVRDDHNLGQKIRLYQIDNNSIQYTFQQIAREPKCTSHMELPIFAHISLTDRCNLNCPYCYAKDGKGGDELSTKDVLELQYFIERRSKEMKDIFDEIMETEEVAVEMADCGPNALVMAYDETSCGGPIPTM